MCRLFREFVPPVAGESEEQLRRFLLSEILSLNGKPSSFQMQRCVELARERGTQAPDAESLLGEYQHRLDEAIRERTDSIRTGSKPRDDFLIFGARPMLELLKRRSLALVILSGTVEHRVREEADLLDLTRYFGTHIYGSRVDLQQWSKGDVLQKLFRKEGIAGEHLLAFGDGPVEIQLTKQAGGLAVGVASDEEENGSGRMDNLKQSQLSAAGADVLIADYRDASPLLDRLLGTSERSVA